MHDEIDPPHEDESSPVLVAEGEYKLGDIFLEAPSPFSPFCVVFEDDGESGYFYAMDSREQEEPILDVMHIYDNKTISDRHKSSLFQIAWSADGLKAILLINDYPHAVFDFETYHGYCRSNFPEPTGKFSNHSHEWSDSCLNAFNLN